MTNASDVLKIYKLLNDHGIQVWIVGGWGIDALLRKETRLHKDLDVLIEVDNVIRAQHLMEKEGYYLKEIWEENQWTTDAQGKKIATAFVWHDNDGCEFDAHAFRLDAEGHGIPAWDSAGIIYTKQDLSGIGKIHGVPVQCITAEMQMRRHTGYELPKEHLQDIKLLHKRFSLEYPE
jgi:lincosamide nucleotidyltransferase A/C/D/E